MSQARANQKLSSLLAHEPNMTRIETQTLDEVLDPIVDRVNRKQLLDLFQRDESTLKRDIYVLDRISDRLINYNRTPRSPNFDRQTVETMWQFRQLVQLFNYEGACDRIQNHLENYYGIQRSSKHK